MAGEIAHIVYAARLLTYVGDKVSHPSYWVGTLFPNIYRIGSMRRFPTHPKPVGLSTLVGSNDFITGMRAHSWIDDTRDVYIKEHRVFEQLPWHPLLPLAFELLEDELLYPSFEDWNLVLRVLSVVHPEETLIVDNKSDIQAWHHLLQEYFRSGPSDHSRMRFLRALGVSMSISEEVNEMIAALRKHSLTKKLFDAYIQSLEQTLL